jgi:hypothetical protein
MFAMFEMFFAQWKDSHPVKIISGTKILCNIASPQQTRINSVNHEISSFRFRETDSIVIDLVLLHTIFLAY